MNLIQQLPSELLAVFREFRTCEFTTLNKSQTPVTWPTLPFCDPANNRFIITTSIGLPEKVFNVRRNPRVSLLFSDPTASGLSNPPTVLVQGDAVAPDQVGTSVAGFEEQLREVFRRQPASKMYSSNPLMRYLFDWYYMRLTIEITPRRILWWEKGDTSRLPHQVQDDGSASRGAKAALQAKGNDPTTAQVAQWQEFVRFFPSFKSAVLTAFDETGYPQSMRCQPKLDSSLHQVRIPIAAGVALRPGAASLLLHSHDEALWNQRSYMLRGQVAQEGEQWILQPDKYTPGMGVHGILGLIQFVRGARRNAANYLQKRNLPRPAIPWEAINACK